MNNSSRPEAFEPVLSARRAFISFRVFKSLVVVLALILSACTTEVSGPDNTAVAGVSHPECPHKVEDIDGNYYSTVMIGEQCWLASNLATEHYRNGQAIANTQWIDKAKYGLLYDFASVVNPAGLCPAGWDVPTDVDFKQLEIFVGMTREQADQTGWRGTGNISRKLKAFDRDYRWTEEERRQVNQSGFSFLPAGATGPVVGTAGDGWFGDLWSKTEFDAETAWYRSVMWTSWAAAIRGDTEKVKRKPVSKA